MSTSPLIEWIREAGGQCVSIEIRGSAIAGREDERGIYALERIPANAPIVTIPRTRLLVAEPRSRSTGPARTIVYPSLHARLANMLLEARAANVEWNPYVESLPANFRHMPVTFAPAVLNATRFGSAIRHLRRLAESLEHERTRMRLTHPAFRRFSEEAFVWARLVVTTRAFKIHIGGDHALVLVPLADMINHAHIPNVGWRFDEPSDCFRLVSVREIPDGGELRIQYGTGSVGWFFANYGFLPLERSLDEIEITAEIPVRTPSRGLKTSLLHGERLVFVARPERTSAGMQRLMSFLRVAHADESQVREIVRRRIRCDYLQRLDDRNERAALDALATACGELRQRLTASMSDRPESEAEGFAACLELRKRELEVLDHFDAWIATASGEFQK